MTRKNRSNWTRPNATIIYYSCLANHKKGHTNWNAPNGTLVCYGSLKNHK